jgi:hypothetical protein
VSSERSPDRYKFGTPIKKPRRSTGAFSFQDQE